jgi:hypothetical protein
MPTISTEPAREELHKLVDRIPAAGVPAARRLLESLTDPVQLALLQAPADDEPEGSEEANAVKAALLDPAPDVSFEQIRRRR